MKCSACREIKPWLIKVKGSLLCEVCKRDSELQQQRNDVTVKHLVDTKNIKNDPEAVAEKHGQVPTVDFSNDDLNHKFKQETNVSDTDRCDSNEEDNTSPDESSHQMLNDEDVQNQQIKEELTIEEAKVQNFADDYTDGEKMSCKLCSFSCVADGHIMRKHLKANHPVERLTGCAICNKQFQGQVLYQQHLQEKHDGFGRECKICLEKLQDHVEVQSHKELCLGRLLFICNSCEKRFTSKESVLKHLDGQCSSANTKDAAFIEKRFKQRFFTCALCDDSRAFEKHPYWKHINEVHKGNFIRCKYCPATFSSRNTRTRHMKDNCTASDTVVRQNVKCPSCPKIFLTQQKLDFHIKAAHYPVSCKICQREFKSWFALNYHRQKEHAKPNRQLQCPYCPKKFYISSSYHRHVVLHRK